MVCECASVFFGWMCIYLVANQRNLLSEDKVAVLFSNLEELILVHLSINFHVSLFLFSHLTAWPSYPHFSVGSRHKQVGA